MKPGGWRSSHRTACSFCFGLRAEGFRPIKQTELLMCQCGSQTGPVSGRESWDRWWGPLGLHQAFQSCEQCRRHGERDRQKAAWVQHMDAGRCSQESSRSSTHLWLPHIPHMANVALHVHHKDKAWAFAVTSLTYHACLLTHSHLNNNAHPHLSILWLTGLPAPLGGHSDGIDSLQITPIRLLESFI